MGRSTWAMIFLNPLFLLGLLAAAIPLLIHLFNFRRPQRINFSSLAFLHELQKSTMQRVRIKQWLLLALRMLTIAALVLAFARPTLEGRLAGVLGGGRTTTAIVLDNSTSMTLRDGGGAWLDQARSVTTELMASMESGDEVFVIPLVSGTAASFSNAASVRAALDDVAPMAGSRRLTDGLRQAVELVRNSETVNRQIYVASDMQAATLSDSLAMEVPDGMRIFLLPTGSTGQPNLAVSSTEIISQIIAEGSPLNMTATIRNFGTEPVQGLVASVFLEGERVGQATLDIPAGGQTVTSFVVTPRRTGWLSGRVVIDDPNYSFDNVRAFTVNVPDERRILLVDGASTGADRFLSLLLSESLGGQAVRFRTDSVPEDQLAATPLGGYDTVVLGRVRDLSSGERSALVSYVSAGGGLLVFPSDGMIVDDYNALLADLGGGSITLPPGQGASAGAFANVDTGHPLFEGMFAPQAPGEQPRLEQPAIFRSILYTPRGVNEQTIVQLTGGTPFLQEIRSGQGIVLLYAVEAGISWSDFPVRGLFVPMMYRSLYWLSSSGSVTGEDMNVGRSLQIRVSADQAEGQVVIRSGNGDELLPAQRTIMGATLLDVSGPFFEPGVYDIVSGNTIIRRFVVHPDPAESDVRLADTEDVTQHLAELTGTEVDVLDIRLTDNASIEAQVAAARTGYELWNVFLGLALVCMLLEMVLARHWRPESSS